MKAVRTIFKVLYDSAKESNSGLPTGKRTLLAKAPIHRVLYIMHGPTPCTVVLGI